MYYCSGKKRFDRVDSLPGYRLFFLKHEVMSFESQPDIFGRPWTSKSAKWQILRRKMRGQSHSNSLFQTLATWRTTAWWTGFSMSGRFRKSVLHWFACFVCREVISSHSTVQFLHFSPSFQDLGSRFQTTIKSTYVVMFDPYSSGFQFWFGFDCKNVLDQSSASWSCSCFTKKYGRDGNHVSSEASLKGPPYQCHYNMVVGSNPPGPWTFLNCRLTWSHMICALGASRRNLSTPDPPT